MAKSTIIKNNVVWKAGDKYITHYGLCVITKLLEDMGGAIFTILEANAKAAQHGHKNGMEFYAHPDDGKWTFPQEWEKVREK